MPASLRSSRRIASALAALLLLVGASASARSDEPLPPEEAFRFSAKRLANGDVEVTGKIADGYYLYRHKLGFSADPPGVKLGAAALPPGEEKQDEFFGRVETYRREVKVRVPVAEAGAAERGTLVVAHQGCWDQGVCYPPLEAKVPIVLAALGTSRDLPPEFSGRPVSGQPRFVSDEARFTGVLEAGSLAAVVAFFFGAGLLLTFTPCVLPMVPILSGIIVGEGREATKGRALALSLAYVLGMAVTYTAIGIAAALSGQLLSAALQNPWVLGAFALIFVALAFSMFGFYDIQLPAALQSRLTDASNRLSGGHVGAVALMGALSAAIVSPCVAAPLAGALLYISQTRDVVLGATALFAMAIGMGVPLVAVGVTEGAFLPKSGHWMKSVKKFFGFLLLGVAVWIVAPVLPAVASMLAWAALLVVGAMYLHALDPLPHEASGYARFWKGVGVLALVVGVALVVGALAGSRDPLQPLAGFRVGEAAAGGGARSAGEVRFERVATLAELEARLAAATRPVMLDFYADWCVSCKEMERFTFTDPRVRERLAGFTLLQVDVTANSADDQALLKRFRLFGPPGIVFFDAQGREIEGLRVIGFQNAPRFLQSLAQVPG
ncbi:MAG: protein-disulfide reductase DsbD [Burkholderiales bacterium]|nr:protein-disulfide reductase DsbD [Burkholderiales bacterium]